MKKKLNDYVAILCKTGGDDVTAAIVTAANKSDALLLLWNRCPGWKTKTILRLYEEDFQE